MSPALRFFAGLWTLRGYPAPAREWTLAEKFLEVKRQGFEGIGGRALPEAPALCQDLGLDYILYLDLNAVNFSEELRRAVAWNPQRINVQLCEHNTPTGEAAQTWIAVQSLAQDLGLEIDLEIHRDTATETPEKTIAIMETVRATTGVIPRLSLDFSHFAVVKHLAPPYAPRLLGTPELLRGARQLHLRPFNGQHAQVPATDGAGNLTPEFRDYLIFVDELFRALFASSSAEETFYVCPELGPATPGGYALSCFPDVWQDAIRVRNEVRLAWQKGTST